MKLKALKLNRPKSAVVLNDSEKKAVRGGRRFCTLYCGNDCYWIQDGGLWACLALGKSKCEDEFICTDCTSW